MNEPSVHLPPPAPGLTADVGESRAHAEHEAWDAEIQRLADVMLYAAQVLRIAQVQSGRNSAADVTWRTLNQAHEAMTKLLGTSREYLQQTDLPKLWHDSKHRPQ